MTVTEALLSREAILGMSTVFVACLTVLYVVDRYIHRKDKVTR